MKENVCVILVYQQELLDVVNAMWIVWKSAEMVAFINVMVMLRILFGQDSHTNY